MKARCHKIRVSQKEERLSGVWRTLLDIHSARRDPEEGQEKS